MAWNCIVGPVEKNLYPTYFKAWQFLSVSPVVIMGVDDFEIPFTNVRLLVNVK